MTGFHKLYTLDGGSRKRLSVLLICLVLAVTLIVTFVLVSKKVQTSTTIPSSPQAVQLTLAPEEERTVQGRYLFSGTIVLARAIEKYANGDYAQPFSKLSTFEPEKYDGWMADLECPVTYNNVSYQKQIDDLVFNCRPEWLPNYSQYFNFVNLSNNHSNNMGLDGFLETQNHMDEAGVQVVGNYDPSVVEDDCEVMALPVRVIGANEKVESGELPVAFCAFHYFFRLPRAGEIETEQKYAKIMPVFGFMHIGVEYLPTAGVDQVNVGHAIIDSGAEFVIGNSPHWVQNGEVYMGKPIFYSTGNFMFDQLDYETQRGLNVDVSIQVGYDDNIKKWLEIGRNCKVRRDNCLELATQQGLKKPKLKLIYAPIASSTGNRKVTQKGDAVLQASVEERLGWASMSAQLGQ